jgi:hypothetical protein
MDSDSAERPPTQLRRHGSVAEINKNAPCNCVLSMVGAAAKKAGITCQGVFERAYTHYGYNEAYGRAVYVQYVEARGTITPPTVLDECRRIERQPRDAKPHSYGCMSCKLAAHAWPGVVLSYSLIYPRVTPKTLADPIEWAKPEILPLTLWEQKTRVVEPRPTVNGTKIHVDHKPKPQPAEETAHVEDILMRILQSGVLDRHDNKNLNSEGEGN